MTAGSTDEANLEKYKDFVIVNCKELIDGEHEDATKSILNALGTTLDEVEIDDDDSDVDDVEVERD